MSKFIQLINLDEIKALRVTCEQCHSYWSVPVPLGNNKLPKKCNYCGSEPQLDYIEWLLEQIDNIQRRLGGIQDFN